MKPPIYSSDLCQFKSASFQNDEQFLRTLAELIDCRSSWRKRIKNPTYSSSVASWFASTFARLRQADRYFSRAEKIPNVLRGCLAKFIEVLLLPDLRRGLRWVNETMDLEYAEELSLFFLEFECLALNIFGIYGGSYLRARFSNYFYGNVLDELYCVDYFSILDEADPELAYNVIVSVVVLCIVYQYLSGYVDRGGTKTYNPGSLEFRATYVSLLLFQGAYVWIKFREVAPRTAYRRSRTDEHGQVQYHGKYEPRFTPPREEGFGKHNHLPLGGYVTEEDAKVVCQIAGFYYGKDEGAVALEDGSDFSIPEMSEQERSLCGEEKRKWVSEKAREVLKEIKEQNAARRPPSSNGEDQVGAHGLSCSADELPSIAPATANGIDEFLGGLSTLAQEHGPLASVDGEILLNFGIESFDVCMPTVQERLNEQLHIQKQLLEAECEAKCNRRLAEERQKNRRLEEEIAEVRQENKRLKIIIQQAAETTSALHSTFSIELESSTEN